MMTCATIRRVLSLVSLVILPVVVEAQALSPDDIAMLERDRAQRNVGVPGQVRANNVESRATPQVDRAGEVDPNESLLLTDSTHRKSAREKAFDSVKSSDQSGLERYGRMVFKNADPTMFASHSGAVGAGYLLGPGDEVILTLWGQKEGRYQLTLDRDGQINIEGVGVVSLNGQSLASATDLLRKRLNRIYSGIGSGTGQMDLTLGKLKQIRVFVVGHVTQQGSFLLSGNTSVLAAVYQAKGPSEIGSEREVEIVRGKTRLKVDLYEFLFRGEAVAHSLQDGDVLLVPPHGSLVQINGDVGRPAIYELLPNEGAKELLGFAGGINATAASTNLLVQRLFENGRRDFVTLPTPKEVLGGSKAPLKDGDVVHVFRGQDPALASVTITGQVRFPGSYPIAQGMRATDLIRLAGGPTRNAFEGRILLSRSLAGSLRSIDRFALSTADSCLLRNGDSLTVYDRTEMVIRDSVRISGAVRNPGYYAWHQGLTVKDLVLEAGGGTWGSDLASMRLETPRSGGASELEILRIDTSLTHGPVDREIQPKAHLAIPVDPNARELELVQVRGWVAQPGVYALNRNGERLSSLWKRIGGLRDDAYLSGASFLRRTDSNVSRIQIDFNRALSEPGTINDLALHPGDSIYVPARPATVSVKGRVNSPANVLWREGKSWRWYIQQAGGLADSSDNDRIYVRYADGTIQTRDNGISDPPTPGSEVIVPFRIPPKPNTMTDLLSGVNLILGTVIAGLTIYVLIQTKN